MKISQRVQNLKLSESWRPMQMPQKKQVKKFIILT